VFTEYVFFQVALLLGSVRTVGTLELRLLATFLAKMKTQAALPCVHFAALRTCVQVLPWGPLATHAQRSWASGSAGRPWARTRSGDNIDPWGQLDLGIRPWPLYAGECFLEV